MAPFRLSIREDVVSSPTYKTFTRIITYTAVMPAGI